jgi:glyoxylase-like metal-dependent hydrolase (beta-lactamase superfamily II)
MSANTRPDELVLFSSQARRRATYSYARKTVLRIVVAGNLHQTTASRKSQLPDTANASLSVGFIEDRYPNMGPAVSARTIRKLDWRTAHASENRVADRDGLFAKETKLKSVYISILMALCVSADAFAADTGPQPARPAAETFILGEFSITSLRDAVNVVPNDGSVFGVDVGPQVVAEALARAGQTQGTVTLSVDALLARRGGEVILIDAGLGPPIPGALTGSLSLAGVAPEEVTAILITHVHSDHVGGLITEDGRPAFRHAVIKISESDWEWLRKQPSMAELSGVIAPQVKTFKPGQDVVAGIKSVSIPGHTPGHVGYMISSQGQTLLDAGDTFHSSIVSLAEPDWTMGYDADPVAGRESRRKLLTQLARDHQLVFAPHFPYPGFGWIVPKDDHFEWLPKE